MRVKVTNDLHCGRSRSRGRGGHRCCWYYCWRATVMKLSCSPMASLPGRGQCVWLVVCLVQMKASLQLPFPTLSGASNRGPRLVTNRLRHCVG